MQSVVTKKTKDFALLCLAFTTVIGFTLTLKTNDYTVLGNSVYSLLIVIGLYYVYKKSFVNINRRLITISTITAILFSSFMVVGRNTFLYDNSYLNKYITWLRIILIAPFWIAIIILAIRFNQTIDIDNGFTKNNYRSVVFSQLVIMLSWVPYLIICYPAIYGYDGPYQINDYLTNVTTHHPILHTYLLGTLTVNFGDLVGNRLLGLFLYTIIQYIILSFSFAILVNEIRKYTRSNIWPILVLLISMFLPINPIMALSTTKNTLFTAFFIIFSVQVFEMCQNSHVLDNKLFLMWFGINSFFLIEFLNQAKYVFIIFVVVGTFCIKKYKGNYIWTCVIVLLSVAVFNGPITSMLAEKNPNDTIKEMLSVPICQLSRTMLDNKNALTKKQREEIHTYIPDYRNYLPDDAISDPVKKTFNSGLVRKKPIKFLKLWLVVGSQHPLSYVNAFNKLTVSLWYPDMNKDPATVEPYWEYENNAPLPEKSTRGRYVIKSLRRFDEFLKQLTYGKSYEKVPVLSLLFSAGTAIWILILCVVASIAFKDYHTILYIVSPLALWATLLFGPVVILRYAYPLISTEPLMLLSFFAIKNKHCRRS